MYYYICEVCGSNFSHRNKNRRFCNRGCSDSWIRNLYISKHKKLEGKRFSRLIVLKYVYSKKKKPFYDCLCDCGKRKIICGYYLKNNTSRSCGCLISDIMRKLRKNPYIKLTTFQREVIIGELLGDGHITKAGEFQFTGISEEHRDCLSKVFNNFNPRLSEYKKGIYRITTKTNDSIREIRNKWYPKNKKRVPKDLILTPIICYHWYIGDGTLTTKSYYSSFIKISTEGFGFFGVHFLKKQFYDFRPSLAFLLLL